MIKRVSFVTRRPDVAPDQFKALWLGEHATIGADLPGVLEYTIDFLPTNDSPPVDGIATLRFGSKAELDAAFSPSEQLDRLFATRDLFAATATAFIVDEHVVVSHLRHIGD